MDVVIVTSHKGHQETLTELMLDSIPEVVVKSFADPFMAVKHLCNNKAELVLAEYELKHMNGAAFCSLLHKRRISSYIAISSENESDEKSALAAGADAFVKGVMTKEVLNEVVDEITNPPSHDSG